MAQRLAELRRRAPWSTPLGINLGKSRAVDIDDATADYLASFRSLRSLADYIVINVSSPNTVGLRRLQAKEALEKLLGALEDARSASRPRPILVKLAPDLTDEELDDSLDAILATGMDGVIATNTTVRREGLRSTNAGETGGPSEEQVEL